MTYNAYTTLNEIREIILDGRDWHNLLTHLGKTKADDEPLHLLTILEINGLDDALCCLEAKSLERLSRHFLAWSDEQLLPYFEAKYPDDTRVRDRIAMLRNDGATPEQREAVGAAAWAAVSDAVLDNSDDIIWAVWDAQEVQLRAMIGAPQEQRPTPL